MLGYFLTAFAAAATGFVVAGVFAGSKMADTERRLARTEAVVRAQADLIRRLTEEAARVVASDLARRDCHVTEPTEEPLA